MLLPAWLLSLHTCCKRHNGLDTFVLFQPQEGQRLKAIDNARDNAEHAVLDETVELATNEWNALGVTDM
jgi:hypothetical protein